MATAVPHGENFTRNEKGQDIRLQNIVAAKAVADAVRTSLGPKGMDKMIQDGKGGVIISNDGATVLKEMKVVHPCSRMLVELSKAQDIEAGDGTTSVVVLAGALLEAAQRLLNRNIHPQAIADAFLKASEKSMEIIKNMSNPIDLSDEKSLIEAATTALNSKVVSGDSDVLAPMAVKAVLRVIDGVDATNVDLQRIRVVKKLGDTVDATELVEGLVFTQQKVSKVAGGPTKIKDAKIGLIQFCLAPPKTDIDNNVVIKDYAAMDRLLREERLHTAKMVKRIASTGCNVLLIQKSILREAATDLALDYLAKSGILVIRDIERTDIDFISRMLHCVPCASIENFTVANLGSAEMVCDEAVGQGGRIVRVTGVPCKQGIVTVLCRASNSLMLDETERSFHDALCVARSLVKSRALVPGGGAVEMEVSVQLSKWAQTLEGVESLCVSAYAEALEVIPYTLAENSGVSPLEIVNDLRNKHLEGLAHYGINVKQAAAGDMLAERVVQPLLVSQSAISLATETTMVILRIDDIVITR